MYSIQPFSEHHIIGITTIEKKKQQICLYEPCFMWIEIDQVLDTPVSNTFFHVKTVRSIEANCVFFTFALTCAMKMLFVFFLFELILLSI